MMQCSHTFHQVPVPRLVITLGDVRGIGPEVVAAALSHLEVRRWAEYLLIGPGAAFQASGIEHLLTGCALEPVSERQSPVTGRAGTTVMRVGEEARITGSTKRSIPSIDEVEAGRWAGESIVAAVGLIGEGRADALVTAPIEKKALIAGGYPYPGHTELLRTLTRSSKVTMLMVGGLLRVALVTTHIPLEEVAGRLDAIAIRSTVQQVIDALRGLFGIPSPRIAVCGLNPHSGEGGILGTADREIIAPVIAWFRGLGLDVSGPHPADTIFSKAVEGEYDAVVAMYHDQGLGPFKLHAFGRGVNMTLGLPFVRTSPDHGTARDIAGRGLADERSMVRAIRLAVEIMFRTGKSAWPEAVSSSS